MALENGEACEFIQELYDIHTEEEVWQIWLQKSTEPSFEKFRNAVLPHRSKKSEKKTTQSIEDTLKDSFNILSRFDPTVMDNEGGEI